MTEVEIMEPKVKPKVALNKNRFPESTAKLL